MTMSRCWRYWTISIIIAWHRIFGIRYISKKWTNTKQRYGLQSVTHLYGECNAFLLSKKDLWRGSLRSMHSSSENIGVFSGEHWSLLRRTLESSPENIWVFRKSMSKHQSFSYLSLKENSFATKVKFWDVNSPKNYS